MDLVTLLRSKKIKVTEIDKWGTYLRKRWEDHFANHLSDQEKKSIYLHGKDWYSGYLWHIFSYKKRDCLQGEQADIAFNQESKKVLLCFLSTF